MVADETKCLFFISGCTQMPRKKITEFDLETFFPYQVRIFYRAVSSSVSKVYISRYGLTVYEWRAMSVLGAYQPMTASDIVSRSSIDKVQVSRAIKGLTKAGLLARQIDRDDRRRSMLELTTKGEEMLSELVPLVREVEEQMLSGISNKDRVQLKKLMEKVRNNTCADTAHSQ